LREQNSLTVLTFVTQSKLRAKGIYKYIGKSKSKSKLRSAQESARQISIA